MSRLSPNMRIFLLVCLIGISAILSGCGYKVTKSAPEALLQTPRASYLLSAEETEVTGKQLILDCSATVVQTEALIKWAK